jgi:hypothetical protein
MMDISKLPKMSGTRTANQSVDGPGAPTPVVNNPIALPDTPPRSSVTENQPPAPPPSIGAEIWLGSIIGLILMMVGRAFASFCLAKLTGQPFHTNVTWQEGPLMGQEVAYFDLEGYTAWTDTGVFLLGLVMVLEAAARLLFVLRRNGVSRVLLLATLVFGVVTVLLNLGICAVLFHAGVMPLFSALAVAVGGWIVIEQVRLLRSAT